MRARRNDDASTTNTSTDGSLIAATSGTSVLPTASAERPEARTTLANFLALRGQPIDAETEYKAACA